MSDKKNKDKKQNAEPKEKTYDYDAMRYDFRITHQHKFASKDELRDSEWENLIDERRVAEADFNEDPAESDIGDKTGLPYFDQSEAEELIGYTYAATGDGSFLRQSGLREAVVEKVMEVKIKGTPQWKVVLKGQPPENMYFTAGKQELANFFTQIGAPEKEAPSDANTIIEAGRDNVELERLVANARGR